MEHDILAHLFPDEETGPVAARRAALVRNALAPLEADRDPPVPPPNLVDRTLGRVAEHLSIAGQLPPDESDFPVGQILAKMTPQKLLTLVEVMTGLAPAVALAAADLAVAGWCCWWLWGWSSPRWSSSGSARTSSRAKTKWRIPRALRRLATRTAASSAR